MVSKPVNMFYAGAFDAGARRKADRDTDNTPSRPSASTFLQPLPFDNSYATLPPGFYARLAPTPVDKPGLIRVNRPLAAYLGVDADWLASEAGVNCVAGNALPEGAEPIAAVYAGHQFGSYNPQLGDGRAILLGELIATDGRRFDLQLKGSGPTPYSRGGDGRSPLGPVLREYLLSEAMHRLGVPTTRALAAVTTGELVVREQPLPGAVLARVASSHIRIGTLEFFAARKDTRALELLVQHVIARHYPEAATAEKPALALLQGIVARQAALIARWQLLGFIHGVMNTDNMLLCGETIDYGPCAFMDTFNPEQVFSSIDRGGRYAYRNQPGIAHWNLSCLARALLPLLDEDREAAVTQAQAVINDFPGQFMDSHSAGMATKLGLTTLVDSDTALVEDLFALMADNGLDFTLTFRQLADLADPDSTAEKLSDDFPVPGVLTAWLQRWQARLADDTQSASQRQAAMYLANPAYIPRNHQVEAVIDAAQPGEDFEPFHLLLAALDAPHAYRHEDRHFAAPPAADEVVTQTFCGT